MATFGSATPVSRLVSQAMPVFIAGALRVALGTFALMPALIRHRKELGRMGRRDWLLVAIIALVGMFGFTAFMLYGMKLTSGVAGATVMSTTPAVTALGSIAFLGERPTWRKVVAVGLAIVGVLVIQLGQGGSSEAGNPWLGAGLVFCAVCCEATYTIVGKMAAKDLPPVLVAALAAAVSIPIFLPFAVWQWTTFDISTVGWPAWVALTWYGLGTLALGSWLWYAGLAHAQGSVAAAFMGVMPASALALSYLLLGEPFRWVHLLGFAIVFASVLLISQEHAQG